MSNKDIKIQKALDTLYEETQDFMFVSKEIAVVNVDETYSSAWPFQFYKEYVSKSRPLLIKKGCHHFPAVKKWNSEYFREHFNDQDVTVAITPNGYADGLLKWKPKQNHAEESDIFVLPEEKVMKFGEFLDNLKEPRDKYVCYIQKQNSNLSQDFSEDMLRDIEPFKWASQVFESKPDAINFWMGDKRAITSMHKDPYENLYCVIDRYKDFLLIPPTDLPYLPHKRYPVGAFENVTSNSYDIEMLSSSQNDIVDTIRWVAVDPLSEDSLKTYPQFEKARKYRVRVEKGDVLYLPALWYHHVQQEHECVAVNFWYDMEFDQKYCYQQMLEKLCG